MKMTKENIIEAIENMDSDSLLELNNTFCDVANYSDDSIYANDEEFFLMSFGGDVMATVRAVSYGDYNFNHDYVKFNGYGNLQTLITISTDDLADCVETIANTVLENPDEFSGLFDFDDNE